jgi:outer membrane lipoprotein SlyB
MKDANPNGTAMSLLKPLYAANLGAVVGNQVVGNLGPVVGNQVVGAVVGAVVGNQVVEAGNQVLGNQGGSPPERESQNKKHI